MNYKLLSNLALQQVAKDLFTMWKVRSPDCPFRVPLSVLSEAWPFGSSLFEPVRPISKYQIGTVKTTEAVPRLQQSVLIQGKQFMFEVDTGAAMAITSILL